MLKPAPPLFRRQLLFSPAIRRLLPVLLALAPGTARAQPGQPSQDVEALVEPASPSGTSNDPNLDRSFLLPTAMTQPRGTLTYSNYELLFHGITYAFTDHLQASLTLLPPYLRDMPLMGSLSIKAQVLNLDKLKLALQGSATFVSENSDSDSVFGFSAIASVCLVADCSSLATFSTSGFVPNSGEGILFAYSGSLTQRLSAHTKLLLEIALASNEHFDTAPGFLFNYGIRFHGRSFAADVGLMRPTGDNMGTDKFVLGFPFVNFSYRVD